MAANARALCLCLNFKNRCSKYILNFNKDKMIQTTTSAGIAQNPVLAAGLSNEKLNIIAELCSKAAMAVNEIECELHGTELKYELLVPNKNESTLWTQLYSLEKMFLSACR